MTKREGAGSPPGPRCALRGVARRRPSWSAGPRPRPPRRAIPGLALAFGALIGISELPASLIVIGAGPVGVEMAQIFHGLGTRVTPLEMAPALLPGLDEVLVARLAGILDRDGLTVRTTGDAAGPPMFAHWATAQAHVVAARILGRPGQAPSPAATQP
jgi:pyruvate/2-oxoglutarate dehydrogenase complex dihydrolipoamide dehydrogenase (E3) component